MCGTAATTRRISSGAGAERDAADLHARHHRFARRGIAEREQLANHLPRVPPQQPALLAFLDDERELFG